ncbi:DUF2683 family protein [Arundinibacter roseus]|uniref:Uncharacterized protein n=1 Tax=Arundinibacter roseus TaxID=2070510 RepID=A0A4R4JWU3_9BACT|nr:DUF2683 family protein [Arundinibacter roseus]TDB59113.1 hypothetical protein EZE20_22535 [Arundinibacter roseus]
MKQVTLNIPDNKFSFFMQLVRSLNFVEVAESPSEYNSEFVAKIQKSRQEYADGNFVTVEKENFKAFLDIQ